jgi:hypothetical protein
MIMVAASAVSHNGRERTASVAGGRIRQLDHVDPLKRVALPASGRTSTIIARPSHLSPSSGHQDGRCPQPGESATGYRRTCVGAPRPRVMSRPWLFAVKRRRAASRRRLLCGRLLPMSLNQCWESAIRSCLKVSSGASLCGNKARFAALADSAWGEAALES